MYLLDSNVCIALMRGNPKVAACFARQQLAQLSISSVVKAELLYGAHKSQGVARNLLITRQFLAQMVCLPFDDECADCYGKLRAELAAAGQSIGANDMLIAATALAHGKILVTHNTREFSRITGLLLEDWES